MYKKLEEGLAVYNPNKQSKVFYARIRFNGKEIRKTTKERELDKAIRKAYYYKFQIEERFNNNLPIFDYKNTVSLLDDFLVFYKKNYKSKSSFERTKQHIELRLKKYFKNKRINEIRTIDIREIIISESIKSATQLTTFKTTIDRFFSYCYENEYLKKEEIPIFPEVEKENKKNYEAFNNKELIEFFNKLKYYINYYKNSKNRKSREFYEIAYDYFSILANTGARPGDELLKAKFNDVEYSGSNFGTPFLQFNYAYLKIKNGKMKNRKKHRTIPLNNEASIKLQECYFRHDLGFIDREEKREKYIFSFSFVNKVPDFSKLAKRIIDELKEDGLINKNKNLSSMSFRKTYITSALEQKTDINLLAEYCGNSPTEIYRTYSELQTVARKEEIYKIEIRTS